MRNEITISELAQLMNVSVHQIRYFEDKGLLLPAYISGNQYRMYSMEQIYQLAHILLLRKLGLPVQAVKACMTDFGPDEIRQMLQTSLENTQAEILRLQQLQLFIGKVLQEHRDFGQEMEAYRVKWREAVNLRRWFMLSPQTELAARQFAGKAGPELNLFEADIHYVFEGEGPAVLCTEATEEAGLLLPAGEYLCFQFLAAGEDELEQRMEQFSAYAADRTLHRTGPLVLIEKSYLSLFSQDRLHYELLQRIGTV
ncbi:MerR family transcriptional regulator [Paenibacillus sonchi]|uniref:MerR family transcriptional regulator n=1 Tax=Paenibacillus sonchi TaxID=373687 RepID=A0A974P768_9BACL|nr:MerR family transcriptional regulator [Paenibacillus sonchi]QQZ58595.1 MerR family transcriptional regulator [Paenibacillus sonchi]